MAAKNCQLAKNLACKSCDFYTSGSNLDPLVMMCINYKWQSQQQQETRPQVIPTQPQERVRERVTEGPEPSPTTTLSAVTEKPGSKDSVTAAEQTEVKGAPEASKVAGDVASVITGPQAKEQDLEQESGLTQITVESTQELRIHVQSEQEQDVRTKLVADLVA